MEFSQNLSNLLTRPHVYTGGSVQKIVFGYVLFLAVALAALAIVALVVKRDIGLFLACVGVALFLAVLGFILRRTAKQHFLITGQEGIIFTYTGHTVFSPWENISRITNPPYWRRYDALQLREAPQIMPIANSIREHRPAMQSTRGAAAMLGRKGESPYDIYHYIPLLFMGHSWRTSGLKDDLERYAPQVFQ